MPVPTASVKVEVLQLTGIPAATLTSPDTRYARCSFQSGNFTYKTGRSRPIPNPAGDFDVTAEASPWAFEVRVNPGDTIGISVDLWEDHGDAAPVGPASIVAFILDPWGPGTFTLASGGPTAIQVRVSRTLIAATDKAFLARAGVASGVGGALVVPDGFLVEITDILGLYKIDPAASTGVPASRHTPGYISEDGLGRIFTNRLPNGTWQGDTQYIEAQVKVTALGAATIPAGAKLLWTMTDADDPTNDSHEFHRDWGRYIDPNDYDAAGVPIGAHPLDNAAAYSAGNVNELLLYGAAANASATARWVAATGGPAVSPISGTQADSALVAAGPKTATTSVRLHCPNVLGCNFSLKAQLTGTPVGIPVHNASTGIMTMWCRLDVEVARMAGAHSLAGALAGIPKFFKPVCVQLDFQTERMLLGAALDKAEMATAENLEDSATAAWVGNPLVFQHASDPGWFFLGAACFPSPAPGAGGATIYNNTAYTLGVTGTDPWVEVPATLADPDYLRFAWTDGLGNNIKAGFSVYSKTVTAGKTRIEMYGNDVTPGFTGHNADGSIKHAYKTEIDYFPQHQKLAKPGSPLLPGGFNVPNAAAELKIYAPGASYTSGISPTLKVGALEYFAGRTVLFTHTDDFSVGVPPKPSPDFNSAVLSTVVHEFLHAFGMPHKCGQWNWRTPRAKAKGHTCCMNYWNTPLLDSANHLLPGTTDFEGDDMCGRHLMEVRRVHLHKNKALKRRGW